MLSAPDDAIHLDKIKTMANNAAATSIILWFRYIEAMLQVPTYYRKNKSCMRYQT
jgi:hypothetical protein